MSSESAPLMQSMSPRIGQIRRVWIDSYGPAFVCIARVFSAANLAEVIVVHSEPDRAIPRDFIVEPNGTKLLFALVLSPDLIFSFDLSLLEKSKVHGQICQICVSDLFRQSFLRLTPGNYITNESHDCLYAGNYEMSLLDRSWVERAKLIDAVVSVSLDFWEYSAFVDERVSLFSLVNVNSGKRPTYRRVINELGELKQTESIELLLERVTSNPYARALVRC